MNKKELNTYEFPERLQEKFQQLMSSKETFSKKISFADNQKLETLYAQLQDVWNQNHTKNLMMELEQSYLELKKILSNTDSEQKNYEAQLRRTFEVNLVQQQENLTKRIGGWKSKKYNLNNLVSTWKKDISEKGSNLTKMRETSESELMKDIEKREHEEQQFKQEKEILIGLLRQKEEKSRELTKTSQFYRKNLNKTKNELEAKVKKLKQNFEEKKESYLKELRIEIAQSMTSCPEELKELLISGELSTILLKSNALSSEIDQLGRALTKGLTKVGVSEENFFQKFDEHNDQK